MQQHMKIQGVGDKKHKCQYCGKDFLQLSHMRQHLRTHIGGKDFKCDHCPKAFRQKSHLLQHMRMHTGDKKYTCEICQRKFTQLSHLQQHIRTHTGDKPYKCSVPGCVKAFSQLSNLQSHSRIHQSDKPYKCNACYKCFSEEAGLLEHIPKHRESKHLKTHICSFCGKSYTQEAYLNKHMSKHADKGTNKASSAKPPQGGNPVETNAPSFFLNPNNEFAYATSTTTQHQSVLNEPESCSILNHSYQNHTILLNNYDATHHSEAARTASTSAVVHNTTFNTNAPVMHFYDPIAFGSKNVNNEELLDP